MEKCNLLQVCVDEVVFRLTRLPVDKVINIVHNEFSSKKSPDVTFTSRFKLSTHSDKSCVTINEGILSSLVSNDDCVDRLDLVNYSKLESIVVNGSAVKLSEMVASLPEDSKEWPLSIDRCLLQYRKVLIFLNRRKGFSTLLPHILKQGQEYGRCFQKRAQIVVTCESLPESRNDLSLRQLRLQYLSVLVRNLLSASGHSVLGDTEGNSSDGAERLHLAIAPSEQLPSGCGGVLLAGDVTSRLCGRKLQLSAGDFLRRRHEDVKQLAEVKRALQESVSLVHLVDAVTRMELLQMKPSAEVCVDLCSPQDNPQLRGALFVLYNYTRISTILRLFSDKVGKGIYPPLSPIEKVDFSLLTQQEEWCLFRYMLMFPHVVESCAGRAPSRPVCPHRLCLFLSELSRLYSSYYRRVRILTEPRDHLLPVMFARLHLLRAVEQVFRNAFSFLDITPLERM